MSVLRITNQNFEEEVLNSDKITIVDFYADWCGPCKMMAPIIDKIAEENNDIKVGKLNVDESGEIAGQFNIMSIPTVVVFKDGKEFKRFVGVTSKDNIINAIKYHTTGKKDMNLLEKIIYMADLIEEGRNYPGVELLRELTYNGKLDEALLLSFNNTIKLVLDRNQLVHPRTIEARNYIIKQNKR